MSDTDTDRLAIALRRLTDRLNDRAQVQASGAAAGVASDAAGAAGAEVDAHAALRQFVHGVGPLFVAKTSRPDQYVDWKDLRGTPPPLGGGGIDPTTLEIDGRQVSTGTVPVNRLPVASAGEASATKLVRSDDPRLNAGTITVAVAGEPLAAGDFVRIVATGGEARAFRADATSYDRAAVGFVAASAGAGETAQVYPGGENVRAYLPDADASILGLTVFLSTDPGHISTTPPRGAGQLLQPLGTVTAIRSSAIVSVLVRYEFRFRL